MKIYIFFFKCGYRNNNFTFWMSDEKGLKKLDSLGIKFNSCCIKYITLFVSLSIKPLPIVKFKDDFKTIFHSSCKSYNLWNIFGKWSVKSATNAVFSITDETSWQTYGIKGIVENLYNYLIFNFHTINNIFIKLNQINILVFWIYFR